MRDKGGAGRACTCTLRPLSGRLAVGLPPHVYRSGMMMTLSRRTLSGTRSETKSPETSAVVLQVESVSIPAQPDQFDVSCLQSVISSFARVPLSVFRETPADNRHNSPRSSRLFRER